MSTIEERFWSKVNKNGATMPHMETPCWEWTGQRTRDGYGQVRHLGRHVGTHRVCYELCVGPIPSRLWVLHRCDVRSCCNPDHLFLGTPKENMDDMIAKGRARHPSGESNPATKITNEQCVAIRSDPRSSRIVAHEYNVNHKVIVNIRRGRTHRMADAQ